MDIVIRVSEVRGIMLLPALVLLVAAGVPKSADPPYVDVWIAGVALGDADSGREFVSRSGETVPDESAGREVFRYLNAAQTEVLELTSHPGGTRFQFMTYRVTGADRPVESLGGASKVVRFQSGKRVRIGLSTDEVTALIGEEYLGKEHGDTLELAFGCRSRETCPILAQVNMPQYKGRYVFVNGILVEFEAGYPQP